LALRFHNAHLILAALLLLAFPSPAQITIGENLSLTSSGTINAGYNGTYGDVIQSSHGLGFGGTAALNGYYYNPNFISFSANPYYNQSRSNSGVGSVSDASGVTLISSIFSGSHFPGSVNYSAAFNSTGNYGIPGISSLDTNGNSQNLGINWNAFVPGFPTLSVGYQQGNSNYSLYGTNENGSSNFRSLNVSSTYNFYGFGLGAAVSHSVSNALIPGVVVDAQTATTNSDSTSYIFTASHAMPWNGSFSTSFNRTDLNSDYLGYLFNGNIDLLTASVGLHPTPKLSFSLGASYTDNLSGSLYQALVPGASTSSLAPATGTSGAGTVLNQASNPATNTGTIVGVQQTSTEQSSHGLNVFFTTAYSFAPNLQAQGLVERRQQTYLGESFGSNLYSGGVYYNRNIAGGFLGASVNLFDSTVDTSSQNQFGYSTNVSYGRRFGAWQVSGYVSYVQNVQTYLVTYNTSAYSFSGSASRRLGTSWYWTASAGTGRTGLTAQPGTSNSSESFSTTLGTRKYAFGAGYSKSDGTSLASGGGLIPTPLPPIIPSELLVGYGGTSYSISASAAPTRRLNASFSYVKSKNNFNNVGLYSWNNFEQENAYIQYQFRQLGINGGYTRLVQGFSASGLPPASVSSFYIGVYRWFNFF
jgi:hypothetical protein